MGATEIRYPFLPFGELSIRSSSLIGIGSEGVAAAGGTFGSV